MYELLIGVIFPSIILLIYWDEFGNLLYRKFHDRRNIRNHVNTPVTNCKSFTVSPFRENPNKFQETYKE